MTSPRVVLDTNVCLDLFVFGDPRCAALRHALDARAVIAVTREDCRAEWIDVLGYPRLKLDAAAQQRALDAYDARVSVYQGDMSGPVRPQCRDEDDQKFVELAVSAGAELLFSRDAELLSLSRRTEREHGFAVLVPEAWGA
ncbi:putative PIN family toxin of toxin-antitoxin system [Luteibacter sp. Sphag1AF]|uniref:putative toxin-antitoxin system toxin component, PIN family n=1 Tax=Luteibacter sp. Sphag1AF TaxID=2587031 RepID=UPI00160839F1|nr:putative toxin-antitoxin system toxin component, PIN family [Luteibacter sp. Sphag1AF]MBB3226740.1 putative PIN family toxin of toxin-antitoxin system [Luteibacter sp. Sphag1AF]